MIVFGGYNAGVVVSSSNFTFWVPKPRTFPATFIQAAPTGTTPAGRSGHSAVYDATNDRMIIFGGGTFSPLGPCLNDVWVLNHASGVTGELVATRADRSRSSSANSPQRSL
jgi:hypothetical protein